MTKNQALAVFNRDIRRGIPNDTTALEAAWVEYTDTLWIQGLISGKQHESWTTPNF